MINEFKNAYRFLSNFYPSSFRLNNKTYTTVEHYYQSQKAEDKRDRETIRLARTPEKAKRLGRVVKTIDTWEETKELVMETGLKAKFDQNLILKKELISTGDNMLVEGNYWGDKYWGVCLKTNKGKNRLGKLLTKLRNEYRREIE